MTPHGAALRQASPSTGAKAGARRQRSGFFGARPRRMDGRMTTPDDDNVARGQDVAVARSRMGM
jgi:hypothetical protein